jgi:nucleoside-diphosphate-sugar epimerase
MKVLITGAGGNLGLCAVPVLEREGHELRLFDFRRLDTNHEFVEGDIRDPIAVARAVAGMDAVVHGAALHGIHLESWSAEDFWSINADGTFTVYQAAHAAGIEHMVLASSMAVYGVGAGDPDRWTVVPENAPTRPADLYGLTKVVAEDTARFYAEAHQMTTVALRLGMFVPETFARYGFRLLFGGVDDRDVGEAAALALAHRAQNQFASFNIMADNALTPDDIEGLDADLASTLERLWPGTLDLVAERGAQLDDLIWGGALYLVDKARAELGYRPRYDFAAFLGAWRRGDTGHYPYAHRDWWGAPRPMRPDRPTDGEE